MSLIAHGGALVVGMELAGATALVAMASTVQSPRRRAAAIAAGLALAGSTAPPLHAAADTSVTAHMVQHLAITFVVAPLAAFALAGSSLHRSATGRRWSRRLLVPRWSPLAAGLTASAVMIVWHVPAAYDGAVRWWWLHGVQHVTIAISATWLWATAGHHTGRNPGGVVGGLGGTAITGSAIGVLLMFAPRELYGAQRDIVDGQVAGALLAATGVVYAAAVFAVAVRGLERARRRPFPSPSAVRAAGLVVAVGLALTVTHLRADTARSAADPADLYRRDCAACHGPDGAGTSRGIPLTDRGTSSVYYALSTGRMPIDHPDDRIERSEPAYTPDQIDALVAYTSTFTSGPPTPALTASPSLPEGGELYRLHCAACHGAAGIGGAQAYGRVAPSVLHATERETAAAIVAGPGGMPSFRAALDDAEVSSVAAYVQYVQDPVDRGWSLRGGRVGEGLVAWVVGVGLLLAFSRWVASRST